MKKKLKLNTDDINDLCLSVQICKYSAAAHPVGISNSVAIEQPKNNTETSFKQTNDGLRQRRSQFAHFIFK